MRTLDEVKHYYKDVTRDEMVLDIYLDMVVYQKVSDELQSYKTKEDKIRELIEVPIDNMSLNWQSKLILAILEGDK